MRNFLKISGDVLGNLKQETRLAGKSVLQPVVCCLVREGPKKRGWGFKKWRRRTKNALLPKEKREVGLIREEGFCSTKYKIR